MVRISLVIPAYNEGGRIANTLRDYYSHLNKNLKKDFEIYVILNGCVDNTLDIVKEFSKKYKQIKYKDIKEAIGKGGAIIEGFKLAQGDLIGFVDADGATKSKDFYDLILNIKNYDGIIASRWIEGSIINVKQPLSKRIGSRGFNFLVKLFFGIRIRDTQCGAKLFKRDAIKKIVDNLYLTRWAFDINLLYLMKKYNFEVKEIPTAWDAKAGSHFNLLKTIPEMFLSIIRLRLTHSPFRFIVKIYDSMPESIKIHHRLR